MSRLSKSTHDASLSLFAAYAEQTQPPPLGTEITLDALAAIARSSRTIAGTSRAPLRYLDPTAVSELPKASKAYVLVVTNAGDDKHCAVTVGVIRPDGARAAKSVYASRDSVRAAFP